MCVTPGQPYFPPPPRGGQPWGEVGKTLIYADEAHRIARFVCEYPDIETGGDLFGYWTHSGAPVVSYAIGPGRGSRHHPSSFYQDADWLHDVGLRLYDQHGLQHIGEWHSHHRLGVNHPSRGDIRTVVRGMAAKNWSRFLLMIATLPPHPHSPALQNYYLVHPDGRYWPLRIQALNGGSPFRTGPDDPREEPILQPAAGVHWHPGPMTPPATNLASAFPGAWFATDAGKEHVRQIAADLKHKGLPCRIHLSGDGRGLKLSLPDAELLLGGDFPATPPLLLSDRLTGGLAWTPSTNLVDWYLSRRAAAPPARQPAQRGQTANDFSAGDSDAAPPAQPSVQHEETPAERPVPPPNHAAGVANDH